MHELVFNIWVRFCNQLFCINCFGRFDVGYYSPVFSTWGSIYTRSNVILYLISDSRIFSFKCGSVSVIVNVFSLFAKSDINCTLCFCFFVLSPWMLQLIIEYKLVCPRKLELDSSPPSCCSIAVVHCASPPIKKYFGHSQLCSFVSFAGTYPGYWGVGLRWDDGAGKSRIMCLGWECRCLRNMKLLNRWAGCIRDSMQWWGIRVQGIIAATVPPKICTTRLLLPTVLIIHELYFQKNRNQILLRFFTPLDHHLLADL